MFYLILIIFSFLIAFLTTQVLLYILRLPGKIEMPPVQITNRPSRTEIKVHIENMLKRPRMYAQHVETLELLVLDNLWHLTGKPQIHDYQSWSDQEYHNKTNTVWWSVPEIALHKRENGVELMASHLSMWYAIVLEELNEAPEDLKDE